MNPSSAKPWFGGKRSAAISSSAFPVRIVPAEAPLNRTLPRVISILRTGVADVRALFEWIGRHIKIQPAKKRLRVCESVSLGEKRFIAVVQIDGQEFLVGGAPNSLSLLACVDKATTFSEILAKSYERKQG